MNSSPSPAQRVVDSARAHFPALIKRVIDTGVQRLAFQSALASDARSATDIRDAGATLYKLRRHIALGFVGEMRRAVDDRAEAHVGAAPAGLDICLDDELPRRLDEEHLRDAAELVCRSERAHFDALFSRAAGNAVVNAGHGLRPEVHARALALALQEFPVRHAVRSAWFAFLGQALGHELENFYAALSQELRRAGVQEAEYLPPVVGGRALERRGGITTRPAASWR